MSNLVEGIISLYKNLKPGDKIKVLNPANKNLIKGKTYIVKEINKCSAGDYWKTECHSDCPSKGLAILVYKKGNSGDIICCCLVKFVNIYNIELQ